MVVDGGGLNSDTFDVGERVIAPFLWSRKIAHVDYLVLSHPQLDHYGGLQFLAEHFGPREFWSNGTTAPSAHFTRLERALTEFNVQRVAMHRGERRRVGAAEVLVQSPPLQVDDLSVNDQSLVVSVWFAGQRILFTGDIEEAEENDLVDSADGTLASTILKVPHHGSHTSSSARFLDAVAPQLAVVSAGFENRFGFPHREVVSRYAMRRCPLVRTDLSGAVQVRVSPQGTLALQAFRDPWRASNGVDSPPSWR